MNCHIGLTDPSPTPGHFVVFPYTIGDHLTHEVPRGLLVRIMLPLKCDMPLVDHV